MFFRKSPNYPTDSAKKKEQKRNESQKNADRTCINEIICVKLRDGNMHFYYLVRNVIDLGPNIPPFIKEVFKGAYIKFIKLSY
jgi:hypothetical protein